MLKNTLYNLWLVCSLAILVFSSSNLLAQGTDCSSSEPFCTGTTYTFPNSTSTPDLGTIDCCFTTPNPAWYFLEIATPGNLTIHIEQTDASGTGIDVDFVCFGPYPSLASACGTIPGGAVEDCSYSAAAVEDCDITGAAVGEVYVLLLTNFSDQPGTITFEQTPGSGTGSTDCSILCGVNSFTALPGACTSATNTYSLTGALDISDPPATGTLTFTNSCGGAPVVVSAPFISPINYSFTGLSANGLPCTVSCTFSADAACNSTVNYTAPAPCTICTMTLSTSSTPAFCSTVCDGTATVTITGNMSASPSINWLNASGTPIGQTSTTATGLCTGTYIVEVIDSTICTLYDTVVVNSLNDPEITSVSVIAPSCFGDCNGQITINHIGGTQFSINNGLTFQPSAIFTGLCSGTYQVVIENAMGCADNTTANLIEPLLLNVVVDEAQDIYCFGANDGLIFTTVSGGTTPYTLNWSNGAVTDDIIDLSPGTYTLNVSDVNGCRDSISATLTEPTQLTVFITIDSVTCHGFCDGTVTSFVGGGVAPYNWNWNGLASASSSTATDVCAGIYDLVVTDNNGCTVNVDNYLVNEPPAIAIESVLVSGVHCFGECNGSIVINSSEASAYSIDGGVNFTANNSFTSLCAQTYNVVVAVPNGCYTVFPLTVASPPPVVVDFTYSPNPADIFNTTIQFNNLSMGVNNYTWTFDSLGISFLENPSFQFEEFVPYSYNVCLVAVNDSGCVDSICHEVIINDVTYPYVPNTFTPNGDGMNDIFYPVLNAVIEDEYRFMIFNRWGELIFQSTKLGEGWDGTHKNMKCKEDVYVWQIEARSSVNSDKKRWIGHINLLR